ncbi:LamG domain-containing protein [Anaerobaca lacustris]|uniref:Discoidin domain-containing protein n=1 Tax=Anaerobaca lacustris TaxID=3044600 RepID=A0AAW6U1D5_9BACT|nr:discoidin domain-containing protein [Sedimentisphaerales bacterium M17dextr]
MVRRLCFSVAWVFALGFAGSAAVQGRDDSLIGWWKFDDGLGTVARDASGRGRDGTLRGGPTWVIGRVDGALQFDGIDDYVEVGSVGISGTAPRTVLGWVKAGTPAVPSWTSVFGFVPDGSTDGTYFDVEIDDTGHYVAHICGDQWILGPVDTQWRHVGGTYDGSAGRWYLDGQLIGGVEGQLGTIDHVRIGARLSNGKYFPGLIDDVRIYNRVLTEAEIRSVMDGTDLGLATAPSPAEGALDVPRDAVLAWTPHPSAVRHNVYFGTSWNDVCNAGTADPRNVLVSQGQAGATFDPDGLSEFSRTYYWRVDGVGPAPDNAVFKGRVWSFTSEFFVYPIEDVVATSNATSSATEGPENTVNGSGLDENDGHSMHSSDMWLTTADVPTPVWIQYEFDRVYKLHEMLVWNYNAEFEMILGFGVRTAGIECSTDGIAWVTLGDVEFAAATAAAGYVANTTVDLAGTPARYVRLVIHDNWGAMTPVGLSEVRFLYVPAHAREPQPASDATDVGVDSVLRWRGGRDAVSHEVYFGAGEDDLEWVASPTEAVFTPPAMQFGATYYWKVDEVAGDGLWPGTVWCFSTQQYASIDGFETYTDDIDAGGAVFNTWLDGWVNGTGATVGYLEAPFAERTIVHSGRQSMPLQYDNTVSPFYSEAERTFAGPQDWTVGGADSLRLYFRGQATNSPQTVYLSLKDNAGHSATVVHESAEAVRATEWQQWRIPLSAFPGVTLSRVQAIAIGVGSRTSPTAGGSGTIYIDDVGYGRADE